MGEIFLGQKEIADRLKVSLWDKSRILAGDRYYESLAYTYEV